MKKIIRYTSANAAEWDRFVKSSKNGTFLLLREYMDYHADRFEDCSFIITDEKGKWETVLPACLTGNGILVSHAGLTYGGFVMKPDCRAEYPLEWFDLLGEYCRASHIQSLIYKPTPYIYHTLPSDEDLYALFRNNAVIQCTNLATVVPLHADFASRLGKRARKRAIRYGITVKETSDLQDFWDIIVHDRNERHNTVPVHSYDEMKKLHVRFPNNIRLFTAQQGHEILAGAVVYVMPESGVIHLQYAAATQGGKDIYATDVIYHHLVTEVFRDYKFFDFGTSNEQNGKVLNVGMTRHKEEFGGHSVVYQSFRVDF